MRSLFCFIVLIATPPAWPQVQAEPSAVLGCTREKIQQTIRRLPKYICTQTLDRTYFTPKQQNYHGLSCDEISGAKSRHSYRLTRTSNDRLRLEVIAADGHEILSWPGSKKFDDRPVDEIVDVGPIGTGPFGTFLNDIFENDGARFWYTGEHADRDKHFYEYSYAVPRDASHYAIRVGRTWITTAFKGTIRIDPQTCDLQQLTVLTTDLLPITGMCQADTTLIYERSQIGAATFLLPRDSILRIVRTDGVESENRTVYSACHEYNAESVVSFDKFDDSSASQRSSEIAHPAIPGAVSFGLQFTSPIDTDTAAAGDPIWATVAEPGLEADTKRVLIPVGAVLHGRIRRLEHQSSPSPHFVISIIFETMEANGIRSPIAATIDRSQEIAKINKDFSRLFPGPRHFEVLMPPATRAIEGSFVFRTSSSRYVIPQGYASRWVTVAPSGQ